ncbi:protein sidekick-1-like [Mytilus californianus]|uniref:protein sidekick-1-like n=1 Tax=Mytilus californianus TaxID=6549 RepID=UPI0022475D1D|nr:protein sidekick-1-like [Mytilus californianus]
MKSKFQDFKKKSSLIPKPNEVTNLACAPSSSTSLIFTWDRPSDPSRVVQGYILNLERTDNLIVDALPQLDVNDYFVETYTYGGLGEYGIYTLSLYTYTSSGNEPTQTIECQTLTDVPAQAPDTVEAVGISYTEIEVDWTEIATKDRNGVLLGYRIIYYKFVSAWPSNITVDNTTLQHTITGLDFDTYYYVGVTGFTSAGDGPVTTDTNKTLGLPTNPPETVTRYYCYEAVPGILVFGWDEMPCTVYVGLIGLLLVFNFIFCLCCCFRKKSDPEDDMHGRGRRKFQRE